MHNFVYLAQWHSQKFSCEPNFGGGGRAPGPLGCASVYDECRLECRVAANRHIKPVNLGCESTENWQLLPLLLLLSL